MRIRFSRDKEASHREEVTVNGHPLDVHVVEDDRERRRGLQGVELRQDEGMLFVFPDVSLRCFALKDVSYPLDVAFLGATGRINSIRYLERRNREACYGVGQYVLETRRGWLREHGVDVGDYVQLPDLEKEAQQETPTLFSRSLGVRDRDDLNIKAPVPDYPMGNPASDLRRGPGERTPRWGMRQIYGDRLPGVLSRARQYRTQNPGLFTPEGSRVRNSLGLVPQSYSSIGAGSLSSGMDEPFQVKSREKGWAANTRTGNALHAPPKPMGFLHKDPENPNADVQRLAMGEEIGHLRQSRWPHSKKYLRQLRPSPTVRGLLDAVSQSSSLLTDSPSLVSGMRHATEDPRELGRKIAAIKQLYLMKNPGKTVSTPEEAERAWQWVNDYYKQHPDEIPEQAFPLFGIDANTFRENYPRAYEQIINTLPGLVRRNERSLGQQMKTSSQDESSRTGLRIKFTKEAQDAPGLPSREDYGDLSQLERLVGQQTPYVEQLHRAEDAGEHRDFRVQTPQGLLSWVLPKRLPEEPGQARLALQQPLHSKDYADFEGTIESGYGAGGVETARKGNLIPTNIHKDDDGQVQQIDFSLVEGQQPERYSLRKSGDDWLMINVSPSEAPDHEKRHFRRVDEPEKVDELIQQVTEDRPASAKIDGALNLLKFMDDQAEILSHRTSKKTDGPIVHTELLQPSMRTPQDIPEELEGKTLEGEVYFETPEGEALPVQEISGLLNKSIAKAREEIEERGLKPRMALFDVLPRGMDEEKKQRLMDKVQELYPELITRPPEVTSEEGARKLKEQVEAGEHPLTEEGLVFRDGRPSKWKTTEETDVIASGFTPGQGKYEGEGIGAIQYKMRPGQEEPTGQVGTGISDELRRQMHERPEDFLGRVLRIRAQGRFPSGALRAPRLLSLHEDYPSEEDDEMEWGPEIESRMGKRSNLRIQITS